MGTMRSRWLIDFDGCIVNSRVHMLSRINTTFGTKYTKEMMTSNTDFWKDTVLAPHRTWAWSDSCFDSEIFLRDVQPNKGIIEMMQLLLNARCPLFVVTDRPRRHISWLARYLAERQVVCPIVSSEDDEFDKTMTAARLSITTVADDAPPQATAYLSLPSITKIFLYDQPWNASFICADSIERVTDWTLLSARIRTEMNADAPAPTP